MIDYCSPDLRRSEDRGLEARLLPFLMPAAVLQKGNDLLSLFLLLGSQGDRWLNARLSSLKSDVRSPVSVIVFLTPGVLSA